MSDFKTKINPLVPFGRLFTSLFFVVVTFYIIIYRLFHDFSSNTVFETLKNVLGVAFCGFMVLFWIRIFIKRTKTYTITDNEILEYNYLKFSTRIIKKDDIKGFSASVVPYNIWDFKQFIIYLKGGTKIDIMQFEYFNFSDVDIILIKKGYDFLGVEPYEWKWFDRREYKYDD